MPCKKGSAYLIQLLPFGILNFVYCHIEKGINHSTISQTHKAKNFTKLHFNLSDYLCTIGLYENGVHDDFLK